jgi:hypothetical protein
MSCREIGHSAPSFSFISDLLDFSEIASKAVKITVTALG